jgi:DNA-directed RNA polymerase specialized sigma24 family protein
MEYIEAAQILGVPLGTVKSRLARARLQMKLKLQSDHNSIVLQNHVHALAI